MTLEGLEVIASSKKTLNTAKCHFVHNFTTHT